MQAANDGLQVVLEVLVLASLAVWGWQEVGDGSRWVLAIGVPLAFAIVWFTLVTRYSASKLDDPSRLRLEIAMFVCAAAALVLTEPRDRRRAAAGPGAAPPAHARLRDLL
jgi:hypothetical protein